MKVRYFLTSESVGEGHPDKVCDQISDAVLDAVLDKDPHGRVACETYITMGLTIVGLTQKGTILARSPSNPASPAFRVIHFLDRNNGQANKDTICNYCFGGDMNATNRVLKDLKASRIIAEE